MGGPRKTESGWKYDLRIGSLNDIVGKELCGFKVLSFNSAEEKTYGKNRVTRWVYTYNVKCLFCGRETVVGRNYLTDSRSQEKKPSVGCNSCRKRNPDRKIPKETNQTNKTTGINHYYICWDSKMQKNRHTIEITINKRKIVVKRMYANMSTPHIDMIRVAEKMNDILNENGTAGFERWRANGYRNM